VAVAGPLGEIPWTFYRLTSQIDATFTRPSLDNEVRLTKAAQPDEIAIQASRLSRSRFHTNNANEMSSAQKPGWSKGMVDPLRACYRECSEQSSTSQ
jgi:hypothetical protein